LSPDDVAFNLGRPKSQNFNDSTIERTNEWTPDYSICVTLTNTSGILFLTFMTIIVVSLTTSAIITWRRCLIKRQKYGNKVKQTVVTKLDHRKSSSSKDSSSNNIITKNTAVPPKKLLAEQQKAAEILSNSKSKKWNNEISEIKKTPFSKIEAKIKTDGSSKYPGGKPWIITKKNIPVHLNK